MWNTFYLDNVFIQDLFMSLSNLFAVDDFIFVVLFGL